MLDNQLYILLKSTIEAAEVDFGISGIPVLQSFQATQQGVNTTPTIYLTIVGTMRHGQPERLDYVDQTTNELVHQETQMLITKFQISALSTQNPANTSQLTAEDIINQVAMILQNQQTVDTLLAQGCGIQLASDTRNPKFLDDRDRFEASPSFDFDITHNSVVTRSQNVIQSTELQIIPV